MAGFLRCLMLVGYVGVEADGVYGDEPHPVPEWFVILVPLQREFCP